MLVYKDNLQVKAMAKAGWLLGSTSTVFNARDLEEAITLLPEMIKVPIELRVKWIVTEKGVNTGLKADHVLCEWGATLECQRGMNEIYGKRLKNTLWVGSYSLFPTYWTRDSSLCPRPLKKWP